MSREPKPFRPSVEDRRATIVKAVEGGFVDAEIEVWARSEKYGESERAATAAIRRKLFSAFGAAVPPASEFTWSVRTHPTGNWLWLALSDRSDELGLRE